MEVLCMNATNINCMKCLELVKSRKRITWGYGNSKSPVVFIGEAPGVHGCDITGIPFTRDVSGEYYQSVIRSAGWTKEDVYTTNMVKCCPPGNRKPTPTEVENCCVYLAYELAVVEPKIIVMMGDTPLRYFFPNAGKITSVWDKKYEVGGKIFIAVPHPAYICRVQNFKKLYQESFSKIRRLVDEQI